MTPVIYILVPVRNRKELTRLFVECLQQQTYTNFQLLLIDDGSSDGTADMVRQYIPNAIVLQGTGNWWWAGGLQQGINWLKSKKVPSDSLVLMINDDVQFAADYLANAIAVMSKKCRTLVLSRFIEKDNPQIIETGIHADFRNFSFDITNDQAQINCLSTHGLFMHWEDIIKIGDFYPRLLPHYSSDWEYTIRAYRKGLKCETSQEILLIPNHAATGTRIIEAEGFWSFLKKYFD